MRKIQVLFLSILILSISSNVFAGPRGMTGEFIKTEECILFFDSVSKTERFLINMKEIEMIHYKENHVKIFFGRHSVSLRNNQEMIEEIADSFLQCTM